MRLRLDELILHEVGEAGHHRQHDEQHRDAERDAEQTAQRDQRHHAAPWPQIASGKKKFDPHDYRSSAFRACFQTYRADKITSGGASFKSA